MSKPILSTPPSSPSTSEISESLVESSIDEKSERKEKSNSEPLMKTKKSTQREAFSSSKSSTSVSTPKDTHAEFNKKIDEARQSYAKNNKSWKTFIENKTNENGDLYLHGNVSTDLHALFNCLNTNPNPKITCIRTRAATMDSVTSTALTKAIKSNPSITKLEILYGWFDAAGLKIFTDSIISSPDSNITVLDLHANNINDDLAKVIANAIKSKPNTKITALNLRENHIGNEGAKALAEAIGTNPSNITELILSDNHFDEEGSKALGNAIQSNSTITMLEMNGIKNSTAYRKIIDLQCELNAKRTSPDSNSSKEKASSTPHSNRVTDNTKS